MAARARITARKLMTLIDWLDRGVVVIAFVTAIGGSMLRDLLD